MSEQLACVVDVWALGALDVFISSKQRLPCAMPVGIDLVVIEAFVHIEHWLSVFVLDDGGADTWLGDVLDGIVNPA